LLRRNNFLNNNLCYTGEYFGYAQHKRTTGGNLDKFHTKPFSFTFLINLVAEKRFLLRSGFIEVLATYSRETTKPNHVGCHFTAKSINQNH